MKRKILGLSMLLMLTTVFAFGQKCKYEYEKTDGLTGKISKAIIFEASKTLTLRLKQVNDSYEIDVVVYFTWSNGAEAYSRSQTMNMEAGDSLTFKLSTGEIISLYASKQLVPVQKMDGWASCLTYNAISVDKSNMEKLSNATISYIRVNLGKEVYDASIEGKGIKQLQDKLKCIMQ